MEKIRTVRGTHDIFGDTQLEHDRIIGIFENICNSFDYQKISTPIIEYSKVFSKTLGDATDIVSKEMYSFEDIGGDKITLRPEGTAPITRAIISNSLTEITNQKFYYFGPMFRRERPQAGRLRQFHQFGVEIINNDSIFADIENILVAEKILKKLKIREEVSLQINTLGTFENRNKFKLDLKKYFYKYKNDLSPESKIRLEMNVMRILDSKDQMDKKIAHNAPKLLKYLDRESLLTYNKFKTSLTELKIKFKENSNLVRGLDYYNNVAFEYVLKDKTSQNTILAGGRYDGLSSLIGGKDMAGVGWAAGVERIKMIIKHTSNKKIIKIISIFASEEKLNLEVLRMAENLSDIKGLKIHCIFRGSLKRKMIKANKVFSDYVILFGEEEFTQKRIVLKDLSSGEQQIISLDKTFEYINGIATKIK